MYLKATTVCVIAVVLVSGVFSARKEEPPKISIPQGNKWAFSTDHVRSNNDKIIKCRATGFPKPKYTWLKDGGPLPPQDSKKPKLIVNEDTGDLNATANFGSNEDGQYQCVATNSKGKASTPPLKLHLASISAFSGSASGVVSDVEAFTSDYLKVICKNIPQSEPALAFSWERGTQGAANSTKVVVGERLDIDPDGNLHFLWVTPEDSNLLYVCIGENTILKVLVRNTEQERVIVKNKAVSDREPTLVYHKDVEVMAGETAKLICIFTYYSVKGQKLTIDWYLRGMPLNNTGRTFIIPNVQVPSSDTQSQEGEYLCEAKLGDKKTQGKVNLKITAPPQFLHGQELTGISAPLGNDAVFRCGTKNHNAYSTPPSWYINTDPIIGCPPFMFECTKPNRDGSPKCIPGNRQCDNYKDCPDNSDEKICSGKITCNEGMSLCNDVCIATGAPCTTNACEYPNFTCRDKTGCLLAGQVCDGKKDCKDKSDEKACPNGDPITVGGRFKLNSERTELIVPSVTLADTMCFQCMVANEYGTAFGDGCLTVIDKIQILYGPNDTYEVEPGTYLQIGVDATTDILWANQMKFEWIMYDVRNNPDTDEKETVTVFVPSSDLKGLARYFTRSQTGKNLTITIPTVRDDEASFNDYNAMIDRQYAAKISHRYDEVILNFTINGKKMVKPIVEPIVEAAASNLWIIALILAIIILFIVVIIIVCYMHRNRGGIYLLDKKEHQAGHDPEQELKDSGFHDVGRVDDDGDDDDRPKEDEVSLSESVKPYESDEDITEEYGGDFDISKFNEDGSFIGLYGDKKSHSKEVTV